MPSSDDIAPRLFTGWLLRRAFVLCRQEAEACVDDDANLREVPILTLLAAAPSVSQTRLATLLDLSGTATGKLLEGLEMHGLVRRIRSPLDRRSNHVSLTPAGIAYLGRLRALLDVAEARVTRGLDRSERAALVGDLQRLLADDPAAQVVGLATSVGYLITRAHKVMIQRAEDAFGPLGISPRDFGALATLARAQPCSQQRLAELLGVSPPAVLMFIDELEAKGLVARRRNAADRRVYDIAMTDAGARILDRARALALSLQDGLADSIGRAADRRLRELLEKIVTTAVDPVATRSST